MLIEEQKLWFLEGCHQQSKCLALSTGEKSDFGSKAIFQSKAKNLQKFFIFFAFFLCDSPVSGKRVLPRRLARARFSSIPIVAAVPVIGSRNTRPG